MSANIKVSGKTYNGIETISVKNTDNNLVDFLLQGVTPPTKNYGFDYVTFIDYDGTIVISYSKEEFLALSALPSNPTHEGLVSEGWNWTLSDAKTYVANNGELIIGQMYHTASGKTEYDIVIDEATGFTATLTNTSGTQKDWGDGTIDTLESHTYATAGNYTIKLSGTYLPSIQNSKKVREVRIGTDVTSIGVSAFYNCYSLQSITIPSSVTSISGAFYNCYSLQSVTIPSNITSIDGICGSCNSLQSIAISSSVTNIGTYAFYQCYSLQSVTIPSSVTSIGMYSFHSCPSLQSITIPFGVTSIGERAAYNCYSLQSVTIPSSVTSIGMQAFYNCGWLTIVTVLATTPPTVSSNSFPSNVTKIYIPHGTLSAYQSDTNWSTYSSLFVELPA